MSDSEIIWQFLAREFPDNHQVIYLYCKGSVRAPKTAFDRVMPLTLKVFSPPISKDSIEKAVKTFLEFKRIQSNNGEIRVKPIYKG